MRRPRGFRRRAAGRKPLISWPLVAITRVPRVAGLKGMPARPDNASAARPVSMARPILDKEREMPKMKTKSSVKKRFRTTASGRIKMSPAKKRHNLRKRSQKMKRHARGMEVMRPEDERIVKKFMPYG